MMEKLLSPPVIRLEVLVIQLHLSLNRSPDITCMFMDGLGIFKLTIGNDMDSEVHTYADNDRYTAKIETIGVEGDREVFLHIDVSKWNKTTLKLIQQDLDDVLYKAYTLGFDCVSFYVDKETTTKFHHKVKPLDYEVPMNNNGEYIVGGWFT